MKPAPSPWLALDALMAATATPTGPEWFTAYDMAARYNCTPVQADRRMMKEVRAGKATKWIGVGRGPAGKNVTIAKYKMN